MSILRFRLVRPLLHLCLHPRYSSVKHILHIVIDVDDGVVRDDVDSVLEDDADNSAEDDVDDDDDEDNIDDVTSLLGRPAFFFNRLAMNVSAFATRHTMQSQTDERS